MLLRRGHASRHDEGCFRVRHSARQVIKAIVLYVCKDVAPRNWGDKTAALTPTDTDISRHFMTLCNSPELPFHAPLFQSERF